MYDVPGYGFVDERLILLRYATAVASTPNWEREVTEWMKPVSNSRHMNSIRATDIRTWPVFGSLQAGTVRLRALMWITHLFLIENSGMPRSELPVVVQYRLDPTLTIDEVKDRILATYVYMPGPAETGIDENTRASKLAASVIDAIRRIIAVNYDAPRVIACLRAHQGDIAWRTQRGIPVTVHENSMLTCWGTCGQTPGPGLTKAELDKGQLVPIGIAQHKSTTDVAYDIWSRAMQVSLPGPKSQFFDLITSDDKADMVWCATPHIEKMRFPHGYAIDVGEFTELNLCGEDSYAWDRADAIVAAREIGIAYNDRDDRIYLRDPMRVRAGSLTPIRLSFDEPGVRVELEQNRTTIAIHEHHWQDPYFKRRLSTHAGASPSLYLATRALVEGDGPAGKVGESCPWEDKKLYDFQASIEYMNGYKPVTPTKNDYTVLVPSVNGGIEERTIDVTQTRRGYGPQTFLPAFTEAVMVPRAKLEEARDDYESIAIGQLNLSTERALQGRTIFRLSLNWQIYAHRYGESCMAMGWEEVRRMAELLVRPGGFSRNIAALTRSPIESTVTTSEATSSPAATLTSGGRKKSKKGNDTGNVPTEPSSENQE